MLVIRALSMPEALVDILADHLARAGLTGANAGSSVFPAPGGAVTGPMRTTGAAGGNPRPQRKAWPVSDSTNWLPQPT
jgi:hypothetical protein